MLASYNLQSAFAGFSFYGATIPPFSSADPGGSLCRLRAGRRPPSDQSHRHTGSHHGRSLRCHCLGRGSDAPEPGPHRLPEHFASAFDFPAIFGGFAGSCMMEGIKRGLYSNEAGMGSAPTRPPRTCPTRSSRAWCRCCPSLSTPFSSAPPLPPYVPLLRCGAHEAAGAPCSGRAAERAGRFWPCLYRHLHGPLCFHHPLIGTTTTAKAACGSSLRRPPARPS